MHGWIKVLKELITFWMHFVKDWLSPDGTTGISMFRIATDVVQIYRTFCTVHDMKTYLMLNTDRHMKLIMTRFRLGRSGVAVHQFRYKRHIDNEPICPLCREEQEDELQFHLCCPMWSDLRSQFIPLKLYRFPILFRLSLHLASTNQNMVKHFSMCLYRVPAA